jgi:ABC-type sulfate transport system permease component
VLAVGFLWGFAFLPSFITIYGTIWALLIAYVALGTPIAVRVMSAAYQQLSFDLEECSRVHSRELVANTVANPDRAGVAVLCRRMGADVLRDHA